jgi:hypothetical protein
MGRTITLSDIKITSWSLDVDKRNVTVNYQIKDQNEDTFDEGQAVFWETIPDPPGQGVTGEPGVNPDNWYQLPAQYSQALTDITLAARSGLLHLLD